MYGIHPSSPARKLSTETPITSGGCKQLVSKIPKTMRAYRIDIPKRRGNLNPLNRLLNHHLRLRLRLARLPSRQTQQLRLHGRKRRLAAAAPAPRGGRTPAAAGAPRRRPALSLWPAAVRRPIVLAPPCRRALLERLPTMVAAVVALVREAHAFFT